MMTRAAQIVQNRWFQRIIFAMILLAGVLAGLETNPAIMAEHGSLLRMLDTLILAIFIVEAALKLASQGRRYFSDGWNVFDFSIVVICCLPLDSQFAAVLRLVRAIRLLRLVSALPKLQLLVGALLKSLGAMGYVGLLLGLMFYIYAVAGIHLFGAHDPRHFGSFSSALLSLFQMITLDDWGNLYADARGSSPITTGAYFVSFIMLGTMIMLNLFIGVITSSMAEMHAELEQEDTQKVLTQSPCEQIAAIERALQNLRLSLETPQPSSLDVESSKPVFHTHLNPHPLTP